MPFKSSSTTCWPLSTLSSQIQGVIFLKKIREKMKCIGNRIILFYHLKKKLKKKNEVKKIAKNCIYIIKGKKQWNRFLKNANSEEICTLIE